MLRSTIFLFVIGALQVHDNDDDDDDDNAMGLISPTSKVDAKRSGSIQGRARTRKVADSTLTQSIAITFVQVANLLHVLRLTQPPPLGGTLSRYRIEIICLVGKPF